jgi:hypothetical protein
MARVIPKAMSMIVRGSMPLPFHAKRAQDQGHRLPLCYLASAWPVSMPRRTATEIVVARRFISLMRYTSRPEPQAHACWALRPQATCTKVDS